METTNYLETLIHFRLEPEYWTKQYYGKYKGFEFWLIYSSSKYKNEEGFADTFYVEWWLKKKLIPKEVKEKEKEIIEFFKTNILNHGSI